MLIVRKWENRRLERHGRKQNGNKTARVSHRRYVRNCGRKPGYSPFLLKKRDHKGEKKGKRIPLLSGRRPVQTDGYPI